MRIFNFQFSIFALLATYCLLPTVAHAASGVIEVDTGSNVVNALEATIVFPRAMKIDRILDGGSTIVIWVSRPTLDAVSNTVSLAGVTPGGFQGKRELLKFEGEFTPAELLQIRFISVRAFRNDETVEEATVRLSASMSEITEDTESPELFKPVRGASPDLYNGDPFVSFLTQDKGLGIDHYEAASSRILSPRDEDFAEVESPLLIHPDDYAKKIYIRAIDRSGNITEVWIAGPSYYKMLGIWAIIISTLTICVLYLRRRLRSLP